MAAGFFVVVASVTASLSLAVAGWTSRPALAACGSLPTNLGTDTISVGVPAAGTYRVWVRELAPSSASAGFYLQIADAGLCQAVMGSAQMAATTWTWVDYQNGALSNVVTVDLTAGSHTVELAGLHAGTLVDKLELVSDSSCIPTGFGTNCTQAAVTSPTPSPSVSANGTVSPPVPSVQSGTSDGSTAVGRTWQNLTLAVNRHKTAAIATLLVIIVLIGAGFGLLRAKITHRALSSSTPSPNGISPNLPAAKTSTVVFPVDPDQKGPTS